MDIGEGRKEIMNFFPFSFLTHKEKKKNEISYCKESGKCFDLISMFSYLFFSIHCSALMIISLIASLSHFSCESIFIHHSTFKKAAAAFLSIDVKRRLAFSIRLRVKYFRHSFWSLLFPRLFSFNILILPPHFFMRWKKKKSRSPTFLSEVWPWMERNKTGIIRVPHANRDGGH